MLHSWATLLGTAAHFHMAHYSSFVFNSAMFVIRLFLPTLVCLFAGLYKNYPADFPRMCRRGTGSVKEVATTTWGRSVEHCVKIQFSLLKHWGGVCSPRGVC